MGTFIDMTGWVMQDHGVPDSRLTVIERAEDYINPQGHRVVQWLCECSCEEHNRVVVNAASARNGKIRSCGCIRKEQAGQANFIDLTGQKFNKLTVIQRSFEKTNHTYWECKCDCGSDKIVIASSGDLKYNHVKSCGCLKKENGIKKRKHNPYETDEENEIARFFLKNGESFVVDLCDFDVVSESNWYLDKNGYVVCKEFGTQKLIRLHTLLCPEFKEVDHKDTNKLNNRRSNFREVTRQENVINRPRGKNNSSGFIGVYWSKKDQTWYSQITIDRKTIHLGYAPNKQEAIIRRLKAELKYFGPEFAPQRHLFEEYGICK